MIDITSYTKLIRDLFTGQSRSASDGVWVQGGGIEIPCAEERFEGKPATTNPNSSQFTISYYGTNSFESLFKTITCKIKSVYVFTFVAFLITSNGPCTVHDLAIRK